MSKEKEQGQVEVILSRAHIHKGKARKAGEKINVTADQKSWLEKQGVVGGQQEDVTNG